MIPRSLHTFADADVDDDADADIAGITLRWVRWLLLREVRQLL